MKERIGFEKELADLGLAEFEIAAKTAPVKNIVLVAGFDSIQMAPEGRGYAKYPF